MTLKKKWLALESHSEVDGDVELMEVPAESMEADLVEIEGQDKEIESLVADGDELESDQENVDALIENAEQSLEDGDGMDETAARATEIATESYTAKWGIRRKRVGIESFSGASRRQSTMVAIESLKDAAIEMWNTFIAFLKELVAKAKDQWLKLTNAGKSIKKRAEKLEARLDSGLGAQDKAEVSGSFVAQCSYEGKVDFAKAVAAAQGTGKLDMVGKSSEVVVKAATAAAAADKSGPLVATEGKKNKANKATGDAIDKTEKAVEALAKVTLESLGTKSAKKLTGLLPTAAANVQINALPGNAYLASFDRDGVPGMYMINEKETSADKKAKTLSESEMSAGVKALFTLGDALETHLKGFRDTNTAMEALTSAVKTAAEKLKDAKAEERDSARSALRSAQATVRVTEVAKKASMFTVKTLGAGIAGYIAASIGAHKKAG